MHTLLGLVVLLGGPGDFTGRISLEIWVFYWTEPKTLHKNSYRFSDF